MSTNRRIDRICAVFLVLALLICGVALFAEPLGITVLTRSMGYEDRLFDNTQVHTLEITMEDWDSFIEACENEEYASCSVTIDGETYHNTGIRAKGNTSLSSVSAAGSERYSFKVEFDQYDNTQTYHGLDKLSLNNLIQDNTMMKDYLVYTMMEEYGVDSPLCSFVYITVNGEDWGLYLAVEGVEESFLQRNYGSDYGELYKPDSMNFMGGDMGGGMPENGEPGEMPEGFNPFGSGEGAEGSAGFNPFEGGDMDGFEGMPEGFDFGGMPQENSDGTAEEMPSQENDEVALPEGFTMPEGFDPFENGDMTGFEGMPDMSGMPSDFQPPEGETEQKPADSPEASNGEAPQSESAGAEPPADFDMGGFGGFDMGGMFGGNGAKLQYVDDDPESYSTIFSSAKTDVTEDDKTRLISALKSLSQTEDLEEVLDLEEVMRYFVVHNFTVNDDSYTGTMIHNYYLYEEDGQLSMIPWDYNLAFGTFGGNTASAVNDPIDDVLEDRPMQSWIFSGEEYTQMYHQYFAEFLKTVDIEGIIDQAYALIAEYVKKDPTKFCTYEEFEAGVSALREFCALRVESVSGQLAGTVPSTAAEQNGSDALVDTGDLNISDMGTMGGGGPGGGPGGDMGGFGGFGDMSQMPTGEAVPEGDAAEAEPTAMPDMGQMPGFEGFGGGMPEGFDPSSMGQMPPNGGEAAGMPEGFDPSAMGQMPPNGGEAAGMPEGFDPSAMGQMPPDGGESAGMPEGFDPTAMEQMPQMTTEEISAEEEMPSDSAPEEAGQGAPFGNGEFPFGGDAGMPQMEGGPQPGGEGMPEDFMGFNSTAAAGPSAVTAEQWMLLGVSGGLILLGILAVLMFRRRR